MRKIIVILIVLSFITGVAYAAHTKSPLGIGTSLGVGEKRGQGKLPSDPHRTFRLVRFVQHDAGTVWPYTSRISKDTVVIWQTCSADDGVTVTLSTKSQDSRIAGVLMSEAITQEASGANATDANGNTAAQDLGKQNWAWICTYGPAQVTIGAGAKAVEGALFGTADASYSSAGTAGCVQLTTDGSAAWDDEPQGSGYPPPTTQIGIGGFFMDAGTANAQDVDVFVKTE